MPKPTDSEAKQQTASLVDESDLTPEQLRAKLADSREEVKRNSKNIEALRTALEQERSRKSVQDLPRTQSDSSRQRELPQALIPPDGYFGPNIVEIYLRLVQGAFGSGGVVSANDNSVKNLSRSLLGVAEVFFSECVKRPSLISSTVMGLSEESTHTEVE